MIINITEREKEILQHIAMGESNPEISRQLHITIYTVKSHVARLIKKFSVRNRVQLATCAIKYKVVKAHQV